MPLKKCLLKPVWLQVCAIASFVVTILYSGTERTVRLPEGGKDLLKQYLGIGFKTVEWFGMGDQKFFKHFDVFEIRVHLLYYCNYDWADRAGIVLRDRECMSHAHGIAKPIELRVLRDGMDKHTQHSQ